MKRLSLCFALICISHLAFAVSKGANKVLKIQEEIIIGKTAHFKSNILEQDVPLNIYLPANFDQQSAMHTYPVIFLNGTHGNQFFHAATGVIEFLTRFERMPESIVVSLNYSGHYPELFTNGMWASRSKISQYGKPERFSQFMREELFPYLKTHYRANDRRMMVGVSGSAIYPFYALLNDRDLFDDYVFLAASDVSGMGFSKTQDIVTEIGLLTNNNKGERTTLVYFAEADDDLEKDASYATNQARLKKQKQQLAEQGFQLEVVSIKNERHYDALLKALMNAFDILYPESHWAPKYRDLVAQDGNAMENIDKFYQALSTELGFDVFPRGDRWNSVNSLRHISYRLQRAGRVEEALQLAKRWQAYWPNSAAPKVAVAKLLYELDHIDKAKLLLDKAVIQAKALDSQGLSSYLELQQAWQSE